MLVKHALADAIASHIDDQILSILSASNPASLSGLLAAGGMEVCLGHPLDVASWSFTSRGLSQSSDFPPI